MHGVGFDYLAWLNRQEEDRGALAVSLAQGLMISPLVAIGLGVRVGDRVAARMRSSKPGDG